MRIILLLAAAGAAAIATAAPARPAGKSTGSPGAWAAGGGHRAGAGWRGRSGARMGHDRRDGHRGGRRPGRSGLFFHGGLGIGVSTGIVAPYGSGFFAGGGGEVRLKGSRPHYDYDRSYPYEWAPPAGGRPEWEDEPRPAEPRPRCTMEHEVRVCRGW